MAALHIQLSLMNGKTRENGVRVPCSGDSSHLAEGHAERTTQVIDVELGKDSTFVFAAGLVLIAIIVLSIVVTSAAGGLGLRNHPWAFGAAHTGMIGLCVFLMSLAVRKHVYRRVRNLCTLNAGHSTEKLVQDIVDDFGRPGVSALAGALARVLSEVREPGFVIRCCPPDQRDVIEPVTFPFEPMVLDEADDATAAFCHALNSSGRHEPEGRTPPGVVESESGFVREIRRRNKLAGVSGWVKGLFAIGIALYLTGSIMSGDLRAVGLMCGGVLLFLFFAGSSSSRALSNQDCWLLVPGGLLVRGGRGRVSLHRYERSQGVLVVLRSKGTLWLAAVSDGESLHSTTVTKDEVDVLLRCWLSPLSPLPIDRYSDFGDSA